MGHRRAPRVGLGHQMSHVESCRVTPPRGSASSIPPPRCRSGHRLPSLRRCTTSATGSRHCWAPSVLGAYGDLSSGVVREGTDGGQEIVSSQTGGRLRAEQPRTRERFRRPRGARATPPPRHVASPLRSLHYDERLRDLNLNCRRARRARMRGVGVSPHHPRSALESRQARLRTRQRLTSDTGQTLGQVSVGDGGPATRR
jgi:hypothetical protein